MERFETSGSQEQRGLQEKIARLDPIISRSEGLYNGGRTLGIEANNPYSATELKGFVEEFELIMVTFATGDQLPFYEKISKDNEYELQVWNILESDERTKHVCEHLSSSKTWPPGWAAEFIDQYSPASMVEAFQSLTQSEGVAGPPGYILRGLRTEAICMLVFDERGKAAATSCCVDRHQGRTNFARHIFVGYVAVASDHKRQGFGSLALSTIISEASKRLNITSFYTGVKPDNRASIAMCEACGLSHNGRYAFGLWKPDVFGKKFTS
ncbi:MAG: GNAT family N-acetyltransferase [Hyphomicrobiaceae bacterium]